jgi:hypothetical protein
MDANHHLNKQQCDQVNTFQSGGQSYQDIHELHVQVFHQELEEYLAYRNRPDTREMRYLEA